METLRGRRTLSAIAGLSLAALAGCGTYNPANLQSMSVVDICELQYMQGRNLSAAARQTIDSELQRRNDKCANHRAEVAQRYADFMYRQMYDHLGDP